MVDADSTAEKKVFNRTVTLKESKEKKTVVAPPAKVPAAKPKK